MCNLYVLYETLIFNKEENSPGAFNCDFWDKKYYNKVSNKYIELLQ